MRRMVMWLKKEIAQYVPDDIAYCEFDCGKKQCLYGEWSTCKRRLETLPGRNHQATD